VARLNAMGDRLRSGLVGVFDEAGIPVSITGLGSLFGIHLTEGVLIDPRGVGTISTAIGDAEIEEFLAALRTVVSRLRQPALS
jgi:glutamate-1-semialdehyde aminotransferase